MRIAVLGYSGSGKSTLAKRLGAAYGAPVLHLDIVQFLPGWVPRDRAEARRIVGDFMQNGSWVIDGNYEGFLQRERLEAADAVIMLSFNRLACLFRAFRRYLQYRGTARACMAPGCEEKFDWEFVCWILHKGRTRKKRAHDREIQKTYAGKTVVLRNQRQLNAYLASLPAQRAE